MNAETVRTLLEQQSEQTDPMRSGNGDNQRGGDKGIRLMPHSSACRLNRYGQTCTCHLRSYLELDRLMETMRDDRATPLLRVGLDKVSLRQLHWHVHNRYRRAETTLKTVRYVSGRVVGVVERPGVATSKVTPLAASQTVVARPGASFETHVREQRHKRSKNALDVRVLVASWHRDVRPELVDLGVVWIAGAWALTDSADLFQEAAA